VKVLFDQGTPVSLRRHLRLHDVTTVYELAWTTLQNGELITRAETVSSKFERERATAYDWEDYYRSVSSKVNRTV